MSMHTPKKSTNISSAIGRMPSAAAPIALPMNAVSEIGVSMMRSLPCFASRPPVAPKMPPYLPMSSPRTKTSASRCISWSIASAMAAAIVSLRVVLIVGPPVAPETADRVGSGLVGSMEDVQQRVLGLRVIAAACEVEGRSDALLCTLGQRLVRAVVEQPEAAQLRAERRDRVVAAQLVDLALGPVGLGGALDIAEAAVGAPLEQRRPDAAPGAFDRLAGRFVDRDRVVAV